MPLLTQPHITALTIRDSSRHSRECVKVMYEWGMQVIYEVGCDSLISPG